MTLIARIDRWRRQLKNRRNPHNLLAIHHRQDAARHGDQFGAYSYGRLRIRRWGDGTRLTVGRYCSIADGVTVFLGGNHRSDWVSTYPFSDFPELWPRSAGLPSTLSSRGDVHIGHDVWIGAAATILSGVTVGHGAIIAAEAVVSRDVAPYAIVAGNPAREVKRRFTADGIERLLALAWWDLPEPRVAELAPFLQSGDLEALFAAAARQS